MLTKEILIFRCRFFLYPVRTTGYVQLGRQKSLNKLRLKHYSTIDLIEIL